MPPNAILIVKVPILVRFVVLERHVSEVSRACTVGVWFWKVGGDAPTVSNPPNPRRVQVSASRHCTGAQPVSQRDGSIERYGPRPQLQHGYQLYFTMMDQHSQPLVEIASLGVAAPCYTGNILYIQVFFTSRQCISGLINGFGLRVPGRRAQVRTADSLSSSCACCACRVRMEA